MGAVVGKIMPRPMGPYSPNTVYDILDIVTYNDRAWMCKLSGTMGVVPSEDNTANWMLIISSAVSDAATLNGYDSTHFATQAEIDAVLDGTTSVGNAITLAGHEAAYFATKESVDGVAASITSIIDGDTTVANATTLDGHESSYFATKDELADITNATTLDGHEASYFASQEGMETVIAEIYAEKGAANGMATLDENGKLVQIPTVEEVGAAVTETYTAVLSADAWGDSAPYMQAATVSGLTENDTPIVDLILSSITDTAISELEAWGLVNSINTTVNGITATCLEDKPSIDLNVQIKVVR